MKIIKSIIRVPLVAFVGVMAFIAWIAIGFLGWVSE